MNFLKNLFGGGVSRTPGDPNGFYVYVRPKRCDQLIEVRINIMNDLSQEDTGDGYFVRKTAQATRCPFPVDMTLHFDKSRRFKGGEIENGEFVTAEEYAAWVASRQQQQA